MKNDKNYEKNSLKKKCNVKTDTKKQKRKKEK